MRNRRRRDDDEDDRPAAPRPWWWRLLLRRPRDSVAVLVVVASATAIVVNAAYLQHGRHTAPMFALRPLPVAAAASDIVGVVTHPRATAPEEARHEATPPRAPAAAAASPRKDPIAELLAAHPGPAPVQPQAQSQPHPPSSVRQAALAPPQPVEPPARLLARPSRQVLAVQRALSEFGYGQLKPTGINDADTRLAVQRFEQDHNLPVTGEITEPMKRALANLVGHPLD